MQSTFIPGVIFDISIFPEKTDSNMCTLGIYCVHLIIEKIKSDSVQYSTLIKMEGLLQTIRASRVKNASVMHGFIFLYFHINSLLKINCVIH